MTTTDNVTNKTALKQYTYLGITQGTPPYSKSHVPQQIPVEQTVTTYDWGSTGTPLDVSTKAWYDQYQLACEFHTLNGTTTSGHFYQYGLAVQVSDDKAYDFGQITNPASGGCTGVGNAAVGPVPTAPSSPTPFRETARTFQTFTNSLGATFASPHSVTTYGSGTKTSETDYAYDGGSLSTASVVKHDEASFPASVVASRGNVTSTTRLCISGCGSSVTTTAAYDETGQMISSTDPCGNAGCIDMSGSNHTTVYDYTDSPVNSSGNTNAYLTKVTDALGHTRKLAYSYDTGELASSTDQNNNKTDYTYADPLNRLTKSQGPPDSGNQRPTTTYGYNDGAPSPSVTTTTIASPNPSVVSVSVMDGLGRVTQTQLTSDPSGTDYIDTVYDGSGQVYSVSNPHRSGSLPTDGTSIFTYDALGRKTSQSQPDGTQQSWIYSGNETTFTDEAGNQSNRYVDALGRLTDIYEAPGANNLHTQYSYDGLNNLLSVNQLGANGETPRDRSFSYDSLSRLLTSNNPETGRICYGTWNGSICQNGYDLNGNLMAKTDARGVTVSYLYDSLNRMTSKNTSDGSFNYSYGYDDTSKSNSIGRLTHASNDVNAATDYYYDAMGRVTSRLVCVPINCGYMLGGLGSYDLAGHLTDSHIATGADIRGSFDGAGRLNAASYTPPGAAAQTLINTFAYGPVGETEATLGNGLREQYAYDNRTRVNAFSLEPSSSAQAGGSAPMGYIDSAWSANGQQQSLPQGGLLQVQGWAVDQEDGSPIAQVVLLIDGAPSGQATLGLSRPDVANVFGNPAWTNSGWTLTVPTTNLSVGKHVATARLYDSSGNSSTTGPSIQFTITSDQPPTIHADGGAGAGATTVLQGGLISIGGWAADPEDGSPVAKVQVLIDGDVIGDAILGGNRPDVASVFSNPKWANSGWTFVGSVKDASIGSHTLTVAAYDSAGNRSTDYAGPIQIMVNSSADTWDGYIDEATNSSGGNSIPLGGTLVARGWAAESGVNPGAPVSRVDVEVDGITVGSAHLGDSRPDVANIIGRSDFANSGWDFSGPLTGIAPGPHIVRARIYTHSGSSFVVHLTQQIIVQGHMTGNSAPGQPARYSYALGYAPNGNISTASDSVSGDWSYSYDNLNRLITAQSANLGASWGYDSFGNRTSQSALAGNAPESSFTFNGGTYRIDQYCHDAAGNLLDLAPCGYQGVDDYAYDAEGKLISSGYGTTKYIYDAEGNRIAKQSNGQTTNVYFYDVTGRMTVETDGGGTLLREELYAGDRHMGTRQNGGIVYAHTNWLGTEAARSDGNGNLCETLTSLPFGDGLQVSGSCNPSNKFFTGKERDTESGLDYFGARYYGSSMGRFTSPDSSADEVLSVPIPFADLKNPQSLNLYSYVGSNPLSRTDPDGHDYTICATGQACVHLTDQQYYDATHGQGNNGINAPAFGQSGNITCGGAVCGTASYMDQGAVVDLSGGQLMGIAGGKALGAAFGLAGEALGRLFGSTASEAAGAGAKVLLEAGTKQAAKDVLDGLADSAQKATLKRSIARATTKEAVSIKQLADGSFEVVKTRPGFDGSQSFTTTIGKDGSSVTVQTAVDSTGAQVHYDPK